MASIDLLRKLALSFPDTIEMPHFEKTSFRVSKKIFATVSESTLIANFKLSVIDQSCFSKARDNVVFPVANKWGAQGWTSVNLNTIEDALLFEILESAFYKMAPKKIADLYMKL